MAKALPSFILASIGVALLAVSPAHAAQKKIGVTSFDAISIEGDFIVSIEETNGASVEANGDALALEALDIQVNSSRTLVVRQLRNERTRGASNISRKPVRLTIRATGLSNVAMFGNGKLMVSGIRAPEASISLRGNGTVNAQAMNSRSIMVALDGAGSVELAGKTQAMSVSMAGAGSVNTRALATSDLTIRANGNGAGAFVASRKAEVYANGMGTVTIIGRAACKIENGGLGDVYCGPAGYAPGAVAGVTDEDNDVNAG